MRPITLPYPLHDYQERFLADYIRFMTDDRRCQLWASPTGSGKSLMELAALQADPGAMLLTPRLEIVAGMLDKCGENTASWSDSKLADVALDYRISTPIRYLNMLAKGTIPFIPDRIILDECHHSPAQTYQSISHYLPAAKRAGLTATPYRGTPRSALDFWRSWDDRYTWVLTIEQAAKRGVISIPDVEIWPLVDDELLTLSNGEFSVADAGDATACRFEALVNKILCEVAIPDPTRCMALHSHPPHDWCDGNPRSEPPRYAWESPTLFAVSTTDNVYDLTARLNAAGMPAVGITQETPRADRVKAFADCVACKVAIVQINVVSEGVDLPIRCLIDMRPTMSPTFWMQLVGRETRPGGRSRYICCCRNLERHGYLFEGMIPPRMIAEAQNAFPKPSQRANARAIGVEGIGRFAPAELKCADGSTATMYNLTSVDGFKRVERAIIIHPAQPEPLFVERTNVADGNGSVSYARWRECEPFDAVTGWQSAPPSTISPKQAAWWEKSAKSYGIDSTGKVTRKNFAALPILTDTKKFRFLRPGG